MAPSGVSYETVNAAITRLLARGDAPTNTAIRQELGNTGSFSTINRLRQEVLEHHSAAPVGPVPELPDPVSHAGHQLLRVVWEEASRQAAAAREVERQAFEEQKAAFEMQQVEMLGEIERLESALEISQTETQQQIAKAETARESSQQTQRELVAAEATIATLREEVAHLREGGIRLEEWMQRATTAEATLAAQQQTPA